MSGLSQQEELLLQVTAAVLGHLIRKQHTDSKERAHTVLHQSDRQPRKVTGKANPQKRKVWAQ